MASTRTVTPIFALLLALCLLASPLAAFITCPDLSSHSCCTQPHNRPASCILQCASVQAPPTVIGHVLFMPAVTVHQSVFELPLENRARMTERTPDPDSDRYLKLRTLRR